METTTAIQQFEHDLRVWTEEVAFLLGEERAAGFPVNAVLDSALDKVSDALQMLQLFV